MSIIDKAIKVILLLGLVAMLAYAGTCVYGNFIAKPADNPGGITMPASAKAAYALVVKNTGTVILTNKYEQIGQVVGARVFVLHGYWEMVGSEFYYQSRDIILDEAIWGEISLTRR